MLPLALILHLFIGSTLAGSAVIVALTMGYGTLAPILVAAVIGFVLSFPVSYRVALKVTGERGDLSRVAQRK